MRPLRYVDLPASLPSADGQKEDVLKKKKKKSLQRFTILLASYLSGASSTSTGCGVAGGARNAGSGGTGISGSAAPALTAAGPVLCLTARLNIIPEKWGTLELARSYKGCRGDHAHVLRRRRGADGCPARARQAKAIIMAVGVFPITGYFHHSGV